MSRGMTTGALVVLLVVLTAGLVIMSIKALNRRPPAAPLSAEQVTRDIGLLPE